TAGATLVKKRHDSGGLDDSVRRVQSFRRTARQAIRDGIVPPEVLHALREGGFRRGPEDAFVFQILDEVKTVGIYFGLPQTGQIGLPIGRPLSRSRQVRFTVGGPRNPRRPKVEPLSAQRNREQP